MHKINFKQGIIPIILGIAIFFALSILNLNSQCCKMKGHGSHSGHSNLNQQSTDEGDTTLIRKGKIDVYSLDLNLDGFVYQDQMHWNVISDKSGKCPLCGMDLEKVKNKVAIKNLKEHDFEVKE